MFVRHGGGFLYRARNDLSNAVAEPSLENAKKKKKKKKRKHFPVESP